MRATPDSDQRDGNEVAPETEEEAESRDEATAEWSGLVRRRRGR